jgi:hypothetical protein
MTLSPNFLLKRRRDELCRSHQAELLWNAAPGGELEIFQTASLSLVAANERQR